MNPYILIWIVLSVCNLMFESLIGEHVHGEEDVVTAICLACSTVETGLIYFIFWCTTHIQIV